MKLNTKKNDTKSARLLHQLPIANIIKDIFSFNDRGYLKADKHSVDDFEGQVASEPKPKTEAIEKWSNTRVCLFVVIGYWFAML